MVSQLGVLHESDVETVKPVKIDEIVSLGEQKRLPFPFNTYMSRRVNRLDKNDARTKLIPVTSP